MAPITLTRSQLDALVAFAAKFGRYDVELEDVGDGRVAVRVVDVHGQPAGEKVLEPDS